MKIQILANGYDYEEVDSLDEFGICDNLNRKIQIRNNQNQDQMVDTIWHEILHAIVDLMNLDLSEDQEEQIVTALGRGLGSIYRDPRNAEFLDYIDRFRPKVQ